MNRIEWHGAIAASDWVDRLHHKLPLPKGCREVLACEVGRLTGRAREAAERVLKARPRVRKIIVKENADVESPSERKANVQ
jgi:hypothetical protein